MQLAGSFNKVHLILGMVKDKEADKVLQLLPTSNRYYFTQAQIERALPAETLRIQAQAFQLTGEAYAKPELALAAARLAAAPNDLIIVCGSIFVVAEIERLVG
jgi:dihydrofolate synthase/folylpolyglutamate synthase